MAGAESPLPLWISDRLVSNEATASAISFCLASLRTRSRGDKNAFVPQKTDASCGGELNFCSKSYGQHKSEFLRHHSSMS
jgi:hypothetical protein